MELLSAFKHVVTYILGLAEVVGQSCLPFLTLGRPSRRRLARGTGKPDPTDFGWWFEHIGGHYCGIWRGKANVNP